MAARSAWCAEYNGGDAGAKEKARNMVAIRATWNECV